MFGGETVVNDNINLFFYLLESEVENFSIFVIFVLFLFFIVRYNLKLLYLK